MNVFHNHDMSKNTRAEQLMWKEFPMHRCCRDGDVAALYSLVTAGSHSIFTEDSFYGWTPVHWAARFDQPECLDILVRQTSLSKSPDIQVSGTRQTPLHVAADNGAVNSLRWLLQRRADPNQKDYAGETALHKASRCGVLEAVVMLGEAGARSFIKNLRNETPMDLARSFQIKSFLSQLIQSGSEADTDTDMDDACDYHNSVYNTMCAKKIPAITSSMVVPNFAKRPRPSEVDDVFKRARLSNSGDDFVPDLSSLFGSPHDCFPSSKVANSLASPASASPVDRNGFHGDDESNGMKTISSCIDGNHASSATVASLSSSADEEDTEAEMEDADMIEDAATDDFSPVTSQLPPHLIPPLAAEEAISNGIGIPIGGGARLDTGKAGRSKCVWFRSSCYI